MLNWIVFIESFIGSLEIFLKFILIVEESCFWIPLARGNLFDFSIADIMAGKSNHLHIKVKEILFMSFPNF